MKKKQMIETATVCGKTITIDVAALVSGESMYFNATEIAKEFGVRLDNFMVMQSTLEYITLLSNSLDSSDLEIVVTKKGKYGGTWLHQGLALKFARWISVAFEFHLDRWIEARLKEEQLRSDDRQASRLEWPEMTAAITAAHSEPKFYHYSTEADLINRIALGMTSKQFKALMECGNVRDVLDAVQIKKVKALQRLNTSMIELGMSYQDRKLKLKERFPTPMESQE